VERCRQREEAEDERGREGDARETRNRTGKRVIPSFSRFSFSACNGDSARSFAFRVRQTKEPERDGRDSHLEKQRILIISVFSIVHFISHESRSLFLSHFGLSPRYRFSTVVCFSL